MTRTLGYHERTSHDVVDLPRGVEYGKPYAVSLKIGYALWRLDGFRSVDDALAYRSQFVALRDRGASPNEIAEFIEAYRISYQT